MSRPYTIYKIEQGKITASAMLRADSQIDAQSRAARLTEPLTGIWYDVRPYNEPDGK